MGKEAVVAKRGSLQERGSRLDNYKDEMQKFEEMVLQLCVLKREGYSICAK